MRNAEHLEGLVMDELHAGGMCGREIQRVTTLCRPTIAKLMRGLEAKGLVVSKLYGRTIVYQLARTRRAA